jgi:hypothetical protein
MEMKRQKKVAILRNGWFMVGSFACGKLGCREAG